MKRILLVDDVATNLKCAEEILKDQYEIVTARSGEQALEILKDDIPDMVMLDINMPGMSGFEVFARMKMTAELSSIPVVFLTAETEKEIEEQGRKMGADDFIHKPYDPEEVSSRVERVFQKSVSKSLKVSPKENMTYLFCKQNPKKLALWANSANTEGYLMLLHFDNFEQIGELFGTEAENKILQKAELFLEEIPGIGNGISHIDSDTYAVYLEDNHDADAARMAIRRIIAGLEFEINESIPEEFEIKIIVSAGIAVKPRDGKNYKTLLNCADKALYFATESGKRKYHFYNTDQKETKEAAEERNFINLLQLKRQFEGKDMDSANGDESLRMTYHIISKYWENAGEEVQIVFFEVEGENIKEEIMHILSEVISGSLRKGDAAIRCGRYQYIAVLLNVSVQNGEMISMRIRKKFEEKTEGEKVSLSYKMRSI